MTTDNDAPAAGLVEALREAERSFDKIRRILISSLDEPGRSAFWKAVEARNYISAALQAPQEAGVSVKALEWRDHRGQTFPDTWTAQTPCGVYEIEERSASDSPAYVATGPLHVFLADKDSLEDAKAAAQADFDKRIRSALSQPVATPAPSQDAAVVGCCSAISPCSWQRHNGMDSVCPTCTAATMPTRPAEAQAVAEVERLREAFRIATDALDGLSYIHDGNPSDAMADMPPVEYARHMLYEARQIARQAAEDARAALSTKETGQ